jgi:peptide/nickel transport system substrate-binding protein
MRVHKVAKVKARRVFRTRKRQVGELTDTASKNIDRHVFRRINNFAHVGRFMLAWMLLMLVLIGGVVYQSRVLATFYSSTQPVEGGILNEGMIGTYTNPNPLFASSTVDLSVSRLIFNSILTHDESGALTNDLASSIERSENGLVYTVKLIQGVKWQDGTDFSSRDILYTFKAIQNPDTRSPYNVSWQGVVVEAQDSHTVTFTLPSPLNSFPLSLCVGIVPAHILETTPFEELRSTAFNSAPVGTGPFKLKNVVRLDEFETIEKRQRIELVRNADYFKGRPQLDAYVLYALFDEEEIYEYLASRRIDSAVLNSQPTLAESFKSRYVQEQVPLLAGTYVFFNTSRPPFDSLELRQALTTGTDTEEVIKSLGYPVQAVDSPLLRTHVGYDQSVTQQAYDIAKANQILDSLGWVRSTENNMRYKDNVALEFSLTTLEGSDFAKIASSLQERWKNELGVTLNITTQPPAELQPILLQHEYDLLLYGISLDNDPDVFAYWHSTQAAIDRYNLSMYKSETADRALEAGRSRPDIALRAVKYKPFLEAWQKDAPAFGLYQPPVFFVSTLRIYNFDAQKLNSAADRFYNVHNWQIQTDKLPLIPEETAQ